MRVAITGSSGFIGRALDRSLEADGHEVLRVSRGAGGHGTTRWDPAAGRIDAGAFEGLDAVVHLAGEPIAAKRWTAAQKQRIWDSRVQSTTLLAETLAGLSARPPVLLSGSGVDAYGDRGDEVLTEASATGSGTFLADLCAAWEGATSPAADAGIRVAHLRTTMVLDGSGGALQRMVKLARVGLLGRLGPGTQWMSWITLADEVRAIRFLLERDVAGPVNMSAPGPVTNATFTKALGAVVHRPTVVPVPRFGPRLVLGRELADTLLFDSKRAEPAVLLGAGFTFDHPRLEPALAAVTR